MPCARSPGGYAASLIAQRLDSFAGCSYPVPIVDIPNPEARTLRLIDLAPYETIRVECACGRIVEYLYGTLQRRRRVPSDTLVWDLQFRLRCRDCKETRAFEISIVAERRRGEAAERKDRRVIVPMRWGDAVRRAGPAPGSPVPDP